MTLRVETFVTGPLPNNLYLVVDEAAHEAVLIDPSIVSDAALARVRELAAAGVRLAAIWNTHGHFDHIYDNARWRAAFPVPLWMHPDDLFYLDRLREQALWFGLEPPEAVPPTDFFQDGQTLAVGSHPVEVWHTPGHSPGSVTFVFPDDGFCICGDVLFQGSVGRTDLPGCSVAQLRQSLCRLLALPPATRVLPGHGAPTTIGHEKASNPFCQNLASDVDNDSET